MTKRNATLATRNCRACSEVIEGQANEAVPHNFHLDCYIRHLRRMVERHGAVCYTCANYRPSHAEGGRGECTAGRKNPAAARPQCRRYSSKVQDLESLGKLLTGHRWSSLFKAAGAPQKGRRKQ